MVVVTTYMRDELLRNGFDANRIEIHAPVPRMGDPSLRSSFSDRNLILYAGQIIRGKGVDVLLESLAKVKSNFECIILGDGNHKAYCEELSRKLGLAEHLPPNPERAVILDALIRDKLSDPTETSVGTRPEAILSSLKSHVV